MGCEVTPKGAQDVKTSNMCSTVRRCPGLFLLSLVTSLGAGSIATAQDSSASKTPLSDAIREASPDVQVYNEHLIILSSPWMEGRLPGTRGMELAREYVERQYKDMGLIPPVLDEETGSYGFRQPFSLGGSTEFVDQKMMLGDQELIQSTDFEMTGLGADAGITAPVTFVGYSVGKGPDDYSSYDEDDDLSGRIAVMFRFEPMNEEGDSQWRERGWSSRAGFSEKFNALSERNPAGVILVNPPGTNDSRANELMTKSTRLMNGVPVFMTTPVIAERILQSGGDQRSIMEWRQLADSGVAAVIMLGQSLNEAIQALDEDQPARSILLACFDGEESGLNGSRHYVNDPLFPLEDHALMINFDMIGRIEDNRLSISGSGTGDGMAEWAQALYDDSELDIVVSESSSGGSDHSSFLNRNIPILFGITPFPLHNDYHTPRDTPDKINREGAVETVYLFHNLAFGAATRPEKFEFASSGGGGGQRGRARNMPRVQLGIRSTTDEDEPGIRVVMVREGLSADVSGVKEGDRILVFNGVELTSRRDLIDELMTVEPGGTASVTLIRDGKEMELEIELQPRDTSDG